MAVPLQSSDNYDMPDTSKKSLRLLLLEDLEDDAILLLRRFHAAGYEVAWERTSTAEGMRAALAQSRWDAILSDYSMGPFDAVRALDILKELRIDLPFIIVSGIIDEETAVLAMRNGAHDFLSKSKLERLVPAVERELREASHRTMHRQAVSLLEESEKRFRSLVSNIPGLVFQIVFDQDRVRSGLEPTSLLTRSPTSGAWGVEFRYVSEGCMALLGIPAKKLMGDPTLFFALVVPEDRSGLLELICKPASARSSWNWEGRLIPAYQNPGIKWVNLRASARRTDSGTIVWDGILTNITNSKVSEQALTDSRAQLAELSEHLQNAKEEERERIAREIHDEIGSALVAIKIELSLLVAKLPESRSKLKEKARGIEAHVNRAMETAGRVARELRPGILKEFGLEAALESHAEDFAQRTGIDCGLEVHIGETEPSADCALALFRIFQETLTNVAKHAQATRVEARLVEEHGSLALTLRDNGRGIAQEDLAKRKSFGLRGIRERVRALRGDITIGNHPEGGTLITLRIPLPRRAAPRSNPAQYDLPNIEPASADAVTSHDQSTDC